MKSIFLLIALFTAIDMCYQGILGDITSPPGNVYERRNVDFIRSQNSLPSPRAHHDLVYDEGREVVFMSGGSTPLNGGNSFLFFNDCWSFDGRNWTVQGNAGNERSGFRMAYDSKNRKIYSFGGYADGRSLGDLRVYENGDWKTLTDIPEMVSAEPGFAYDRHRDKLVVFGGSGGRGIVNNSIWEWNGTTWTKFDGEGPEGRQAFVMVYDSRRNKIIVTGGMDGTGKELDDNVWEYDGTIWNKILHKGEGPGSLVSPGYTYDSKRGVLLVFGGMSAGKASGVTWSWDGRKWERLADNGPSPRFMGYMAYDGKRDRVVLFGGRPGWPNDVNDTWEWDGTSWKEWKK